MAITTETFRRRCEEKMQEGNPFIGIAYDDMRSFLFMYTGPYSITVYHIEYIDRDKFGRDTMVREETFDKWRYQAVCNNRDNFRELVTWEEVREGKPLKGDIAKLRKYIAQLERRGRLCLMTESDGKRIIDQRGGVFNV